MDFTPFERDLVRWFVEHARMPELAQQLKNGRPASRRYTGVGMYLALECHASEIVASIANQESCIQGPLISSPSLKYGAGSLLWLEKGVAGCIEVFTYDDPFLSDLREYALKDA